MRAALSGRGRSAFGALICGLLVGLAMPPWGWWPLAFVGIAGFGIVLDIAPGRARSALLGWCFAAGWLFLGMAWMWFLSAPGYVLASALFAGFHSVAALVSPSARWRVTGRAAAHTLAEAIRFCWPFGGVPLASLPISQAGGPLLGVARVGGAVLFTWLVFQLAFLVAHILPRLGAPKTPDDTGRAQATLESADPTPMGALNTPDDTQRAHWWGVRVGEHRPMVVAAAGCVLVLVASLVAPTGATGDGRTVRVAAVQGGGPQGTRAINSRADEVLDRHLRATATIAPGSVDVVVWPENIIDVPVLAGSKQLGWVTAEGQRLNVPMVVSVTEDTTGNHFLNAQVVVTPEGDVISRYDKVRRVPFGEYMPMRDLLHSLGAPTNLVPRDAVAGTTPGFLQLPDGTRLAVAISWEVFFGGRVNEGVEHRGELVINPTNGSSYTGTVLQTQQVASSRLRAVEQGRWVIQVAPTGFSAFINPNGDVIQRSGISEARVLTGTVTLHTGRTWYSHLGNIPFVFLAALALLAAMIAELRAGRPLRALAMSAATDDTTLDTTNDATLDTALDGSHGGDVDDHRDGPIVDQGDGHLGAESTGRDSATELPQAGHDGIDQRLGDLGPGRSDP